jgi:hypothetical protein
MLHQIVAAMMLGEGVVFGALSLILYRKKHARLTLCERTWGDVVEVKEHPGSEGATRHPVIRYRALNGQELTFESKFGRSNWPVKPGDHLAILVNRNDPTQAEVVNFMAQWGLPLVFAIVSAASIIGAPIVFLALKH